MIDLTGRPWADKPPRAMTEAELDDAITAYGASDEERDQATAFGLAIEWEIRHGIHSQ